MRRRVGHSLRAVYSPYGQAPSTIRSCACTNTRTRLPNLPSLRGLRIAHISPLRSYSRRNGHGLPGYRLGQKTPHSGRNSRETSRPSRKYQGLFPPQPKIPRYGRSRPPPRPRLRPHPRQNLQSPPARTAHLPLLRNHDLEG